LPGERGPAMMLEAASIACGEMAMSEPTPPKPPTAVEVSEHLHTIARLLRSVPHLDAEAQQLLAELVDELSRSLESGTMPAAEVKQLTEHITQLVYAAHPEEPVGVLGKVSNRMNATVTSLEARAPHVAGLARQLIDALSDIGI
jgi:hypothetical protein